MLLGIQHALLKVLKTPNFFLFFPLRTALQGSYQAHGIRDFSCITVLGCSSIPAPLTSVRWV